MINKILPLGKGICYELFLKEKIKEEEKIENQTENSVDENTNEDSKDLSNSSKKEEMSNEQNYQNILIKKMVIYIFSNKRLMENMR